MEEFKALKVKTAIKLSESEVKILAWLVDLDCDAHTESLDLLEKFSEKCWITQENSVLLQNLLKAIGRGDLAGYVPPPTKALDPPKQVCPFRALLYKISTDMTDENIKNFNFLCDVPGDEEKKSIIPALVGLMRQRGNDQTSVAQILVEHMKTIDRIDHADTIKEFIEQHKHDIEERKHEDMPGKTESLSGGASAESQPLENRACQLDVRIMKLNKLILEIQAKLEESDLQTMKDLCRGYPQIPPTELEESQRVFDFFQRLRDLRLISVDDLIFLQALLHEIGRGELNEKVHRFAEIRGNDLCFYKPLRIANSDGYRYIELYLKGSPKQYSTDYLNQKKEFIAGILEIEVSSVVLVGVCEGSLTLTFLMLKEHVDKLQKIFSDNPAAFAEHDIYDIHPRISSPFDFSEPNLLHKTSKLKIGEYREVKGAEYMGMDLAAEGLKLAAPSASSVTSEKPGTSSESSGKLSLSLKESFDIIYPKNVERRRYREENRDILLLQGGLFLLSDHISKDLKLLDMKGNLLQQRKPSTMDNCCLAYLGGDRVACLTRYRWLNIFNVTSSYIHSESVRSCENYSSITALDSNTLAAACRREKRIDIISIKGKILRSIAISEHVHRACLSQDGSLICIHSKRSPWRDVGEGILEIDLSNGKELLKRSDIGRLADVATTRDGQIIVCSHRGIDLLDAHGSLVRTLWSLPQLFPYTTKLSVYDDVMVCSTTEQVYVFELTY